jgi:hypothetical protein
MQNPAPGGLALTQRPRYTRCMATLTPGHDAVLALIDWLPEDAEADTELVAELLRIPEAADCLTS